MSSISRFLRQNSIVRIVIGLALAAAVLAALGWLVTGPYKGVTAGFDSNLRYFVRQIHSPMWTAVLLTVGKLGSTLYLAVIGGVVGVVFLFLRWFRPFLLLVIVMAGQAALHHGFKWLIARPRPSALMSYKAVEDFSFPSGHAIGALCLYGAIAWLVAVRLENSAVKAGIAIFSAVIIFLIGVSRAYIGIHYPSDVLAGFIAGAIWSAAIMSLDRRPL